MVPKNSTKSTFFPKKFILAKAYAAKELKVTSINMHTVAMKKLFLKYMAKGAASQAIL